MGAIKSLLLSLSVLLCAPLAFSATPQQCQNFFFQAFRADSPFAAMVQAEWKSARASTFKPSQLAGTADAELALRYHEGSYYTRRMVEYGFTRQQPHRVFGDSTEVMLPPADILGFLNRVHSEIQSLIDAGLISSQEAIFPALILKNKLTGDLRPVAQDKDVPRDLSIWSLEYQNGEWYPQQYHEFIAQGFFPFSIKGTFHDHEFNHLFDFLDVDGFRYMAQIRKMSQQRVSGKFDFLDPFHKKIDLASEFISLPNLKRKKEIVYFFSANGGNTTDRNINEQWLKSLSSEAFLFYANRFLKMVSHNLVRRGGSTSDSYFMNNTVNETLLPAFQLQRYDTPEFELFGFLALGTLEGFLVQCRALIDIIHPNASRSQNASEQQKSNRDYFFLYGHGTSELAKEFLIDRMIRLKVGMLKGLELQITADKLVESLSEPDSTLARQFYSSYLREGSYLLRVLKQPTQQTPFPW